MSKTHGDAPVSSPTPAPGEWRLEILGPEGRVERDVEFPAVGLELGREGTGLAFPDDPDIADRHARLRLCVEGEEGTGGSQVVEVVDHGGGTGVWLRIRGSDGRRLKSRDQIWLGAQVLVAVQEAGSWKLHHYDGQGALIEVHSVPEPGLFIGRGSRLVLDEEDLGLSRRHAQVVYDGDELYLYDRSAHNGTYLKLREPEWIGAGSEIRLGRQHLRIARRAESGAEAATGTATDGKSLAVEPVSGPRSTSGGGGLAARLRALSIRGPADEAGSSSAEPPRAAHEESGADEEPLDRSPALMDGRGENVLVVIDSEAGSVSLEIPAGQTVLEAVQAAGLERGSPVDWECGDGGCGVCVLGVVEGADRMDPPDPATGEMKTIQITEQVVPDPKKYRLACLARVRGTVRLRRLH